MTEYPIRPAMAVYNRSVALLVSFLILKTLTYAATATSVREADSVCAKCHQQITRDYSGTPMANASGLARERLIPGKFTHTPSGVEYQVSTEGENAELRYRKPADAAIESSEKLDYFLGSGHLGITYLYSKNGYLLESPIAYYPDLKTYDMKPGLGKIDHMPGALPISSACLRCHMSAVQSADPGTENHYSGLPFLNVGITCESCHGDTRAHVATQGIAAVVNPLKLRPAERDSTCILCHLEGDTSVEHRDRSVLDFKPGQNIEDYLSYFAYVNENTTQRGVSEIEQFSSSQCKRSSGAAMSCMNCHDPHRTPAPSERVSFYRGKCLACHTQPQFISAHYSNDPDCTSCHMPKSGAKNIPHVAWTDHRIRKRPDLVDLDDRGNSSGKRKLMAILPGSTPRELALAYYNLAVNGNSSVKAQATTLVAAEAKSSTGDEALLRALGILSEWNGDPSGARESYRAILKQDRNSLVATTNLGTLLARSGDLTAAAELWRPAFERNEDILALGQNLATLECMLGEKDRAVEVLRRVLVYSPDLPEIRNKLRAIETGNHPCPSTPPSSRQSNP
jgi:tetratricopeptide (TPR) repeat protein